MEIIGNNFFCNLGEVHLNLLDPSDFNEQELAFKAASISVAALLHHQFVDERYRKSREFDPIVGVSITGLFDFFVNLFGVEWLYFWKAGRPEEYSLDYIPDNLSNLLYLWDEDISGIYIYEQDSRDKLNLGQIFRRIEFLYLDFWKEIVFKEVGKYCDKHNIKKPNRCTTVQPSGTKSLLTNASPGWHPPKGVRYIRRITFGKDDPVALACIDYGYSVIPSQSDKDQDGNLLTDPFDPRVTEWLVEIPSKTSWADLPGCDAMNVSQFSALAQFDFYMQVQSHYVTHNTSATIEVRESEIEELGTRIYQAIQNNEGYISAALLARFDDLQAFPRMPFEPINKATYEEMVAQVQLRRISHDFIALLAKYDNKAVDAFNQGAAACDSDKCLLPEKFN